MIVNNVRKNDEITRKIIKNVVEKLPATDETCGCRNALKKAIMTNLDDIPNEVKQRLQPIIGRYL